MLLVRLAILVLAIHHVLAVSPVVNLSDGAYCGVARSDGTSAWKAIRYAAPPLGDLRFRAPTRPPSWGTDLMRDATRFGPVCFSTNQDVDKEGYSEDCLFVNVFAPTIATTSSRLPVYVQIQGGGFETLSNADYDGTGLIQASDMSIVIVTFNYRVGPYGFLASKEVVENGHLNVGLKDQRCLLHWVQENIAKFGGDPGHVVIGGGSAGGASVDLHLSAYGGRDDGLFHAAAAESQSFGAQFTVEESQYQYQYLIEATGCSNGNGTSSTGTSMYGDRPYDSLQCLRDLPIATLQSANINIPTPGGSPMPPLFMWSNCIDGDFTPDYTYNMYAQGKFLQLPVIFGDDTNEGTIFAPQNTSSYVDMNVFLLANFPNLTASDLSAIDSLYPQAEAFPNSGPFWRTAANAYGEMRYICPGIFISDAYASRSAAPNWNYHYDVHDPANYADGLGTTHTEEISAIWGMDNVNGAGPASYNTTNAEIVTIMQGYWTSFIRTMDPNPFRAPGTPLWEVWSADSKRRILLNTTGTHMEATPLDQRQRCAYLSGIGARLQQ